MERSVVHIKEGEAVHDVTAKEAAVRDAKDK
jgi:hypothetical protein